MGKIDNLIISNTTPMEYGFFDAIGEDGNWDRTYTVSDFNTYFEGLVRQTGVYKGIEDEFKVNATYPISASVTVGAGKAIVGGHWVRIIKPITVTLPMETGDGPVEYDICLESSEADRTVEISVYNEAITLGKDGTITSLRTPSKTVLVLARVKCGSGDRTVSQDVIEMIDFAKQTEGTNSHITVTGTNAEGERTEAVIYSPDLYNESEDKYYNGYIESILHDQNTNDLVQKFQNELDTVSGELDERIDELKGHINELTDDEAKYILSQIPTKVSQLTNDAGYKTVDTTYEPATTTHDGLMSSEDKNKLDKISDDITLPWEYIDYIFDWSVGRPHAVVKNTNSGDTVKFFCTGDAKVTVRNNNMVKSIINNKIRDIVTGAEVSSAGLKSTGRIDVKAGSTYRVSNAGTKPWYVFAYNENGLFLGRSSAISTDGADIKIDKTFINESVEIIDTTKYIVISGFDGEPGLNTPESYQTYECLKDVIYTTDGYAEETNFYIEDNKDAYILASL